MTAKKLVQGLMVTMALCLSVAAGRAADYRFFLMGGGSSLLDQRNFPQYYQPYDYSSNYAGGAKVMVGIEVPWRKIFGFEGSYSIGRNNLEVNNPNVSPTTTTGYGVMNNRISVDLVGHGPDVWKGVRPYAVAGVEYDLFSPTSAAQTVAKTEGFAFAPSATLSSQGMAGVNVGGGIDYKVGAKFDFRIDVRDHITGSPTYGLPSTSTTASAAYFPITGVAHNIEYSVGIVYRFSR